MPRVVIRPYEPRDRAIVHSIFRVGMMGLIRELVKQVLINAQATHYARISLAPLIVAFMLRNHSWGVIATGCMAVIAAVPLLVLGGVYWEMNKYVNGSLKDDLDDISR